MMVPSAVAELAPFVEAGVLTAPGVHFAAEFFGGESVPVQLAAALAVEAVQASDSCLVLDHAATRFGAAARPLIVEPVSTTVIEAISAPVQQELPWPDVSADAAETASEPAGGLPWPDAAHWQAELATSELVDTNADLTSNTPLVLHDGRVFLRRFWLDEHHIASRLRTLTAPPTEEASAGGNPIAATADVLDQLFPSNDADEENLPRQAASVFAANRLTVLTGGPGTGKTWTLARLLALTWSAQPAADVALVAPTGKAAQRMKEAVVAAADGLDDALRPRLQGIEPMTMHRLLGLRPGERPFRNANNQLPHDVVVVDEASMISLPLMGDLVRALSPRARLVLVGDPYQLASVEAGSILEDLVQPTSIVAPSVASLKVNHRSTRDLDSLFGAVNDGDADLVVELCRNADGGKAVEWIELADEADTDEIERAVQPVLDGVVGESARALIDAAQDGDTARCAEAFVACNVLAATRYGRLGVGAWTERIERLVVPDRSRHTRWYVGRPVIVTRNDYINGLFNGDSGVVLNNDVFFPPDRRIVPAQLADIETWWAMTVHKSQGSEFDHVVVSLDGSGGSGICTRELLYTAVTRARSRVTLIASEQTLRDTVTRRVQRASGLRELLQP